MDNRIVIEAPEGTFGAYIAWPTSIAAPAVVVLQELFGVSADIRATCDELAAKGFIAIAPDLFWRQEPGVDLDVASEESWQHGLRLYTAFDRDAGVRDVMETVRTAVELKESSGKVALLGFCLGALMVFITAARYEVDAAVAYHGGDTEKYLAELDGLRARYSCTLPRRTSLSRSKRRPRLRQPSHEKQTRPSTAILASVTRSHGITGRTTMQ